MFYTSYGEKIETFETFQVFKLSQIRGNCERNPKFTKLILDIKVFRY